MKNYRFPFMVSILAATTLAISISSFRSQSNSVRSPLFVSRKSASQTFDSLADLREYVKKFIKSFFELAESAST